MLPKDLPYRSATYGWMFVRAWRDQLQSRLALGADDEAVWGLIDGF
jgi:hypothetical protein